MNYPRNPTFQAFLFFLTLILVAACAKEEPRPVVQATAPAAAPAPQAPPAQPSAPTAAAGGKVDPCSLLTVDEASEIMGLKAGTPQRSASGAPMAMRICQWTPADETQMGLIQVSILQNEGISEGMRATGYTVDRLFQDSKAQLQGQPVPGFGQDAFFGAGMGLTILKNGMQISVSAGSSSIVQKGEQGLPAAKKVAEKVMGRI